MMQHMQYAWAGLKFCILAVYGQCASKRSDFGISFLYESLTVYFIVIELYEGARQNFGEATYRSRYSRRKLHSCVSGISLTL